jgi:hypothetical protein
VHLENTTEFNLVAQRNAVHSDPRNRWLDDARYKINGADIHPPHSETASLIEPQGPKIVVRCDEPDLGTLLRSSGTLRRTQESGSDPLLLLQSLEGDDLAPPVANRIAEVAHDGAPAPSKIATVSMDRVQLPARDDIGRAPAIDEEFLESNPIPGPDGASADGSGLWCHERTQVRTSRNGVSNGGHGPPAGLMEIHEILW